MKGDDLLKEVERRIMKDKGTKSVTDSVLAKTLGITQPQLGNYRGKDLSPRQVVNLLEKHSKAAERQLVEAAILPIVEFFPIDLSESPDGARWEIFGNEAEDGEKQIGRASCRERVCQ